MLRLYKSTFCTIPKTKKGFNSMLNGYRKSAEKYESYNSEKELFAKPMEFNKVYLVASDNDGLRWWMNGNLHREIDSPAIIRPDGTMIWVKNGVIHRDGDKPAKMTIHDYESIWSKFPCTIKYEWYDCGVLHREGDKPVVITNKGYAEWRKNGALHRDGDLPAKHSKDYVEYYKYGIKHRAGGLPAVINNNDETSWWEYGELHRDGDEPAVIRKNGSKEWWKHGILHREGGLPAKHIIENGSKITKVYALNDVVYDINIVDTNKPSKYDISGGWDD